MVKQREFDSKIVFESKTNDEKHEIWVMNPDGSNQIQLTNTGDNYTPFWSPDRSKIAFLSARNVSSEIYIMNNDGSNQKRLTDIHMSKLSPRWYPDGSKIIFTGQKWNEKFSQIYAIDIDGYNVVKISDGIIDEGGAVLSSDGEKIAFVSTEDYNCKSWIYVADVKNNKFENKVRLTEDVYHAYGPNFLPNGEKIVFCGWKEGRKGTEIYIMNSDGTQKRRLTESEGWWDTWPIWSPDGTKIAFVSTRDGSEEIYWMNADGSNQTRITYNNMQNTAPDWG